jgi:hypothetical protein
LAKRQTYGSAQFGSQKFRQNRSSAAFNNKRSRAHLTTVDIINMKITSTRVTAVVSLLGAIVCRQTLSANEPAATAAPVEARAGTAGTIQSYLDSLAAENKLSGAILVAKKRRNHCQ